MSLQVFYPVEYIIVEALRRSKGLTRNQLVACTNLPRTTIFDNMVRLEAKGLVRRQSFQNGKKGRPIVFFILSHPELLRDVMSIKREKWGINNLSTNKEVLN